MIDPTVKNHEEKIIGYKAVKKDKNGYYTDGIGNAPKIYFELGKEYAVTGSPALCKNGIHFFRHYCFALDYLEAGNVILKVKSLGKVQEDTEKCVTDKIKIIELDYEEEIDDKNNSGDMNSGNRNLGNWNSGDMNSGNWNSGYMNSGDWNSGDWNSGDMNSGDWNSGNFNSSNGYRNYFCTQTRYFLFDIECSEEEVRQVKQLDMSWFDLSNGYKEAWQKCPKKVLNGIKKLKNFNAEKFFDITGIK